jgi:hypothetical protein
VTEPPLPRKANKGAKPMKSFHCDHDLWLAARTKAHAEDATLTSVLTEALQRYVDGTAEGPQADRHAERQVKLLTAMLVRERQERLRLDLERIGVDLKIEHYLWEDEGAAPDPKPVINIASNLL